jgi:RND family efflux transporter MFP subunit
LERKTLERKRLFAGEVMVIPGRGVKVDAPLTGILTRPDEAALKAGMQVTKGAPLFVLQPLVGPEARLTLALALVDADGQISVKEVQLKSAKIALTRAEELVKQDAGSKKAVDEAQAHYNATEAELAAARTRKTHLEEAQKNLGTTAAVPVAITAPSEGYVRALHALPGLVVTAGAPLLEIADTREVWLRVAVYAGDLDQLVTEAEAGMVPLTAPDGGIECRAERVYGPPSADALAATVDLYYRFTNSEGQLRPGQRVGVMIRLRERDDTLVVPEAAAIHDIHGNVWVYTKQAEHTFVRRRVELLYVHKGQAVLANGPPPGTLIVTDGAAELYGTELGFAK